VLKSLLIITITATSYFLFDRLNSVFFDGLEYSYSVHWVYLPSGLKMALILVFLTNGAIGVALASTLFTYLLPSFDGNHWSLGVTGLIMGLTPLWTRHLAIRWVNLDPELSNLTSSMLFRLSLLFAVIPPVIQQLWFFHSEMTVDFLSSTAVMMIGDWVGIVFFLWLLKLTLPLLTKAGLFETKNQSGQSNLRMNG
jgi:hypothetical protein